MRVFLVIDQSFWQMIKVGKNFVRWVLTDDPQDNIMTNQILFWLIKAPKQESQTLYSISPLPKEAEVTELSFHSSPSPEPNRW